MAQEKKKAKLNIPMCLALILLCLTMFTTHLMSGLYAKYATRASGGDDARVAKFGDVTIVENADFNLEGKLLITPGVNIKKDITVNYTSSEVASYVFVLLDVPAFTTTDNRAFSGMNEKITWSVADGWTYLTRTDEKYVYYQLLNPNDVMKADFLEELAEEEKQIEVKDTLTEEDFGETTKFEFNIQAYAAQYNSSSDKTGIEHAVEAWNSVKLK